MGINIALVAFALAAANSATSQPSASDAQTAWTDTANEANAINASISVARHAGTMSRKEVRDLGDSGIDLVAQYATPDEEIFGTIFIYKPSMVESGLTFLATDEAIRRRMGPSVKIISDGTISAGGVENAGRRVIYSGNEGGLRSALGIVQAGKWMIKFRVSGPGNRANEIAGNLDALVAGTRFGKGSEPLPAHVISVQPCKPMTATADAHIVKPTAVSAMAISMMAMPYFKDEKGAATSDPTGRVPDRLCLAESSTEENIPLLTFRTLEPISGLFTPRIFQLFGDAGLIVEVTRPAKGTELFALRHSLAGTMVYGGFSAEPSSSQLKLIRTRTGDLPIVAAITEKPAGNGSDIKLDCDTFAEGCSKKE